jgi:hypothetical protein
MRHQDLTINHILESWVYADAAHRTGASGFAPGDVGRISYQTDTKQYWRLTAVGPPPGWTLVGPQGRLATNFAAYADPNVLSIVSVQPTYTMLGLGNVFTPQYSGNVLCTIAGRVGVSVAPSVFFGYLTYGTGAPPANKAPLPTGAVPVGNLLSSINSLPVNEFSMFVVTAIASGLTLATPYWFDIAGYSNVANTANIASVQTNIVEL